MKNKIIDDEQYYELIAQGIEIDEAERLILDPELIMGDDVSKYRKFTDHHNRT